MKCHVYVVSSLQSFALKCHFSIICHHAASQSIYSPSLRHMNYSSGTRTPEGKQPINRLRVSGWYQHASYPFHVSKIKQFSLAGLMHRWQLMLSANTPLLNISLLWIIHTLFLITEPPLSRYWTHYYIEIHVAERAIAETECFTGQALG